MKKQLWFYLALILAALILPPASFAGQKVVVTQVEGYGSSRNQAVQNALIECLKQTRGVNLESQTLMARSIRQQGQVCGDSSTRITTVDNQTLSRVKEATKGLIHSYEIQDAYVSDDGEWCAVVSVKQVHYTTPGISPHNRRKMAVLPFGSRGLSAPQGTSVSEAGRQFTQRLVTQLTQTRRFTILDREYARSVLSEKQLILSPDAPLAEQAKLGGVLGADYLMVGRITQVDWGRETSVIEVTGETQVKPRGSVQCDYRIIVPATRQIKWSDSVTVDLADWHYSGTPDLARIRDEVLTRAARRIVRGAVGNIYPIRVAQITGAGELALNQGGATLETGEELDLFLPGKKVTDTYTGESLGASESWVARARVVRLTAKMAYAQVISGNGAAVVRGTICRPAAVDSRQTAPEPPSKADGVEIMDQGGVKLPFD